ncbi:MAG: cupin domain-containing protein [Bryobacteraceae bacterium]
MNTKLIRRKSFLHTAAAAIPALSALAQSIAPSKRPSFKVAPGAGRPGKLPGAGPRDAILKISGDDTGGEFALFEIPPGNPGPPLHLHHIENELFWVLEGELDVQVGSDIIRLTAGSCAYAPRMTPHTWQPVGGHDVRFLAFAEPAGHLEEFIAELLRRRRSGGPVDPASMKSLFEKYEMEVVGPALPQRAR